MKLAQFIQTKAKHLFEVWEDSALALAPELESTDSPAFRGHARSMLGFIAQCLVRAPSRGELKGRPVRIISQITQELGALRLRLNQARARQQWESGARYIDELTQFVDALDQLIASSASSDSDRKDLETRLIQSLLSALAEPAAIFDSDGKLLFLNGAMGDLIGVSPSAVIGRTLREIRLDFAARFQHELAMTVTSRKALRREFHCRAPSGFERYFDCQLVPVFNDHNEVEAVVKTMRDITQRKETEYRSWQNDSFDQLTGLPNHRLFFDRLDQAILEAQRRGGSFALLFIDLDRFGNVNAELGHKVGDSLLTLVAKRLDFDCRAIDTVARIGEDEFTLILKETSRYSAKDTAQSLLTGIERVFDVDSHRVNISGSIGVAVFPDDGKTASLLLDNARQAMFAAKDLGGRRVQTFERWMAPGESEDKPLERELEQALRKNQLEVYYQPVIDLQTGSIDGAEALLRWNHPEKGLLTPDAFLNGIEQSNLADRIATMVLERAVICQFRWRDQNDKVFPISVNESLSSFVTRSRVDQWRERLKQNSLDESWVTRELSLTAFNSLLAAGCHTVQGLGLPGSPFKLAIDGFGIGPTPLMALQKFSPDRVKLDRELTRDTGQGGDADRTVEALIAMAQAIDVQVVAVGVETEPQLRFLSLAGCDYAQGLLFSGPLCQDDFEVLLTRNRQEESS